MSRVQVVKPEAQGKIFYCRKQSIQDKWNYLRPLKPNCAEPWITHWVDVNYEKIIDKPSKLCWLDNWALTQLDSKWSHAETWGHLSAGMSSSLLLCLPHSSWKAWPSAINNDISWVCFPSDWLTDFITVAENCKIWSAQCSKMTFV